MGRKLQPLLLTSRHRTLLSELVSQRSTERQYTERISIILKSNAGESQTNIAQQLGLDYETIRLWRSRWILFYDTLLIYEKGIDGVVVKDHKLVIKMLEVLSDKARSGAPRVITVQQEQLLTALACESPTDYGIIRTNWSHETLAEVSIKKGIFEQISARYVGILLKKK